MQLQIIRLSENRSQSSSAVKQLTDIVLLKYEAKNSRKATEAIETLFAAVASRWWRQKCARQTDVNTVYKPWENFLSWRLLRTAPRAEWLEQSWLDRKVALDWCKFDMRRVYLEFLQKQIQPKLYVKKSLQEKLYQM